MLACLMHSKYCMKQLEIQAFPQKDQGLTLGTKEILNVKKAISADMGIFINMIYSLEQAFFRYFQ